MFVGPRRCAASVTETAELVNVQEQILLKCLNWVFSRKTWFELASCGRQQLSNPQAERRITKLLQGNKRTTMHQVTADLNHESSQMTSNALAIVHSILCDIKAEDQLEHLCCLQLKEKTSPFAQKHVLEIM